MATLNNTNHKMLRYRDASWLFYSYLQYKKTHKMKMIIYRTNRNKTRFENQEILPRNPFATQFGAISERGHFLKVLS